MHTKTRARTWFCKVLIIMLMSLMFMADLCYIFIYIIKWFLKSPACFWSHTKYKNYFNWSMPTVKQIWRNTSLLHYYRISIFLKKHLKAIWPSQITQSISGHCIWAWNESLEICSAFSMLIYVNIPVHPLLDYSDMYPDIPTWLQSHASLSSHVYTLNRMLLQAKESELRVLPKVLL